MDRQKRIEEAREDLNRVRALVSSLPQEFQNKINKKADFLRSLAAADESPATETALLIVTNEIALKRYEAETPEDSERLAKISAIFESPKPSMGVPSATKSG